MNPWEQQDNETSKAFEAFVVYRDLGFSRSIRKVSEKVLKTDGILKRWKKLHNWEDRVIAYDKHIDGLKVSEHEREVIKARQNKKKLGEKGQKAYDNWLMRFAKKDNPDILPDHIAVPVAKLSNDMIDSALGEATETIKQIHSGEVKTNNGIDYSQFSKTEIMEMVKNLGRLPD